MATGFQTAVNLTQAPAVAGDFATANPWWSAEAGQGAYVAGSGGVTVGRFAWASTTDNTVSNAGTGVPTGFVHREFGQSLITAYLAETSNLIPAGFMVTLFKAGDFWAKNDGAGAVTISMKAFASNTTGQVSFAAAAATVAGSTETKWYAQSAGAAGELIKISNVTYG